MRVIVEIRMVDRAGNDKEMAVLWEGVKLEFERSLGLRRSSFINADAEAH
jgi:hypothetical protein